MKWLTNLLRRRSMSRNRNIFEFYDGARLRRVDPAVAVRSLETSSEFDWAEDPGLIEFGDVKALTRTVRAVQAAFGVTPYDEAKRTGLTESETVELLISFVQYLEFQKKSGSGLLILPVNTASKSSDTSTTKPNSDSGSTSNDNNSETASPST